MGMNRRGFFRRAIGAAAGVAGSGLLGQGRYADAQQEGGMVKGTNLHSSPSTLKITDMRYCVVQKPGPSPCPIIRIDTNQGVYGLGEVRDAAGYQYAMVLKNRLLNENPLRIDYLFNKIAQFGGTSRQAGGICAVEMALWDIAGKVYDCPIYQMLGGKWRDTVRVYADTTESRDPVEYGRRAKERKAMGLTWMKMDLGIDTLSDIPGAVMQPSGQNRWERSQLPHPFTGIEVTDKGVARLCEYVAAVRENIGYDMPLSMDHLGHFGVKSAIKLGKAYEKFNLEWIEDVLPWQYGDLLKEVTMESPTPTITGEDIYLFSDFENLCQNHIVDKIHPDLATSGGIWQTKKIGDMALKHGVPMAMHMAGTPICCMANAHCAAATENFLAMENHSLDVPWWQDLVVGIEKPIINQGFIKVPEGPGLGVTLNDEVVKQHLLAGTEYFAPTPQWNERQSADDALWS